MNNGSKVFATLCNMEQDGCYLMMHLTKKENDINKDKYIGVGGHIEHGESPEECIRREIMKDPIKRRIFHTISDINAVSRMKNLL